MNNFLANNNTPNLARALALEKPGDKFSEKLTKTKKLVLRQVTDDGKNKKTAVVNKNKTVLYQSIPNKKD